MTNLSSDNKQIQARISKIVQSKALKVTSGATIPVMTSPLLAKERQVTYFGLSLWSKIPVFLLSVRLVWSSCQKLTKPLPTATIVLGSSGWNSALTTVSAEHFVSVSLCPYVRCEKVSLTRFLPYISNTQN